MRIAIIIPYYNGDEFIIKCLESVVESSRLQVPIYIINNSDRATLVHSLRSQYPMITIVDTRSQIGFGRANNIGAERAISDGAEVLVVHNQDIIVDIHCYEELLSPLVDDPSIAITAPLLYTYDFASVDEVFIKYFLSQCPMLIYDAFNRSMGATYDVDTILGACFAVRVETVKEYGLFDPLYFMYAEDEDLCRRLRYAHKRVCIAPRAKVAHMHSNRLGNQEGSSRRRLWKRRSDAIYRLKDLDHRFMHNALAVLRDRALDYLRSLATLNVLQVGQYLAQDTDLVRKLPHILASRRREDNLRRAHGALAEGGRCIG
jgi:GT2 family glycosyltransferase